VQELRKTSSIPVNVVYKDSDFEDYDELLEMDSVSFYEGASTESDALKKADIEKAR